MPQEESWILLRLIIYTFISLFRLSKVNFCDWFKVTIPQSDAPVSPTSSKTFFTGIHTKYSCLPRGKRKHHENLIVSINWNIMELYLMYKTYIYPTQGQSSKGTQTEETFIKQHRSSAHHSTSIPGSVNLLQLWHITTSRPDLELYHLKKLFTTGCCINSDHHFLHCFSITVAI